MPEKRTRRTPEQLAKDYEEKIKKIRAHADEQIASLERKKENILNPQKKLSKAEKLEAVFQQAARNKMTGEEAADKLGIDFETALAGYKKPRKRTAPAETTETSTEPAETTETSTESEE